MIREVKEFFPFIMQGELTNLFGPAPVDGKAALDALIDYSSKLRGQRIQMLTDKEASESVHNDESEEADDNESIDDGYSDRSDIDDVDRDASNDDYCDSGSGGGPGGLQCSHCLTENF